ncbi:uncharacterized protein LOC26527797 [Drosophila mojavensis]|uniref:Uncharacterized protein n=1 Tax=Drosophila mojavensis TaxID=7230 RepID=A0A0Q9X244_DROMO|nr:uncharacterized protein LOC26527797 [Drosophila mojavensis]KRG02112.1 uncharacterized protein Dmoj_GI26156 [Drosophila mojavensis]
MAKKLKVSELKKLYEERWKYPPTQKPPKIRFIACGKNINYGIEKTYEPCWKSPMPMTVEAQFGPCWDYPPERYKRRPLPPPCRGATIPPDLLVPEFEHCKTVYTRFDFRLEECVHQQILFLEHLFRKLEVQFTDARTFQIEMAKRMRYQSIRRRLLIGSACGIKIYPEYLSQMAEKRALCDFQKAHNAIKQSNADLIAAVKEVRNAMPELRKRLDKLDQSVNSPYISSLERILQTIQDVYDYFFEVTRKYKTWEQLIDAAQEHSVDDYLALLRTEQNFESFKHAGTAHCTCMRCQNRNPLDPYLPYWCQGCDRHKKDVKLVQTEVLCHKSIKAQLDSSDTSYLEKQSDTSLLQAELEKLNDDLN